MTSRSNSYNSKDSGTPTIENISTTIFGISEETKKEYKYVVGIDFGTTYSGVAYSDVDERDGFDAPVITPITRWPMSMNQMTSQAPTRSVYKNGKLIKWGHQKPGVRDVKDGVNTISMFKLLLSGDPKSEHIPNLPQGVTVVQAISDYLKAIFNFTLGSMRDTLGKEVDQSKLRFCLTVPAVWTEKAKIIMREAAIEAGIVSPEDPQDRLLLVGEPEAAALYCETVMKQYELAHNDTFLICDAGGGTVDLVVYRIYDKDNDKFLIEEVGGVGGLCGSVKLDEGYRNFVDKVVKELIGEPLNSVELDEIVKAFADGHKHNVCDPDDEDYDDDFIKVVLPHRYYGKVNTESDTITIEEGDLMIHPSEIIQHVFDPVVKQVLQLVESQFIKVEKKLDAIFLVGGFGQSSYLFTQLKKRYSAEVKRVGKPVRGEMAIVRGAVLMGLNPRFVKQRVIRRTYGYECALEFVEGVDPEFLRSTQRNGKHYCNNRFRPYALKGEIKDIDYFCKESFSAYYDKNPSLHLFAYDGDVENIPRYTNDKSVAKIVHFDIELPHLPSKGPNDLIHLNVKFFLYQTEIKLLVEIEDHVIICTGSYPKEDLIDEVQKLKITGPTSGTQAIASSYNQNRVQEMEVEDNEIGIQGHIPEQV